MNAVFMQSTLAVLSMQGLPFSCLCAGMFPLAILLEAQMIFALMGPTLIQ